MNFRKIKITLKYSKFVSYLNPFLHEIELNFLKIIHSDRSLKKYLLWHFRSFNDYKCLSWLLISSKYTKCFMWSNGQKSNGSLSGIWGGRENSLPRPIFHFWTLVQKIIGQVNLWNLHLASSSLSVTPRSIIWYFP